MAPHEKQDPPRQVAKWLAAAENAVVFTGAGMSTESGIPDFRSPGGIWDRFQPVYFDEFCSSAAARHEYWRQKSQLHQRFASATANRGHEIVAGWGRSGLVKAVITQNIDGLHQLAGSPMVLQLHGTARQAGCLECHIRFEIEPFIAQFLATDQVPACPECGGLLKHATISFGQALPEEVLTASADFARQADLFLAIGSSLVVEPAASLPRLAASSGARLVIINRDETPLDARADAVVRRSIGEALAEIDELVSLQLEGGPLDG